MPASETAVDVQFLCEEGEGWDIPPCFAVTQSHHCGGGMQRCAAMPAHEQLTPSCLLSFSHICGIPPPPPPSFNARTGRKKMGGGGEGEEKCKFVSKANLIGFFLKEDSIAAAFFIAQERKFFSHNSNEKITTWKKIVR